jgi:hypothetical protein
MVLEYGSVEKLKGKNWFMCELRSDKTVEPTMKRLGREVGGIFRSEPLEVFIPIQTRDLDVFELGTVQYVFVRSSSFPALLRLKQITGIVGLVTEGDCNRPSKAIPVEDVYVQSLISQAEEGHRKRAIGIEVGSFVRVLSGECRDFCGVVEVIGDGSAMVRVTLRTKYILQETPIRNLLNLSHVPENRRVYYYGPMVDKLFDELGEEEAAKLIEQDLHLDETMPTVEVLEEQAKADEPKRHSRQRTVTALVKKLVLIEGMHNPLDIARAVIQSLKTGEIKATRNLFIVYSIIKDRLMKDYFKKQDPSLRTYRDVIHKYGKEYKFSANQIAKIDPEVKIPVLTQEVCRDGRSKEARKGKGDLKEIAASEVKVVEKKFRGPKKRKKLATDKCNTCYHTRVEHKVTTKGSWGRCNGISDHKIHSWVAKNYSGPCTCARFKERATK